MKLKLSSYYPSFLDSFRKILKEIVSTFYMIQNKPILSLFYMKGYKNFILITHCTTCNVVGEGGKSFFLKIVLNVHSVQKDFIECK